MRLVRLPTYVLVAVAGLYLLAAVLYAIPVVSGALDDTMEVRLSRPDPSIVADYGNGLTPGQRQTFYHVSQGAEILPWILLTAVDVADPGSTKPFVENLERYGLLQMNARRHEFPRTTFDNPGQIQYLPIVRGHSEQLCGELSRLLGFVLLHQDPEIEHLDVQVVRVVLDRGLQHAGSFLSAGL